MDELNALSFFRSNAQDAIPSPKMSLIHSPLRKQVHPPIFSSFVFETKCIFQLKEFPTFLVAPMRLKDSTPIRRSIANCPPFPAYGVGSILALLQQWTLPSPPQNPIRYIYIQTSSSIWGNYTRAISGKKYCKTVLSPEQTQA